jgi:hypothetical protein
VIRPQDVAFHTPPECPFDWAETNLFIAWVPEANLHAWVYVIARPGVGAMVSDVGAYDTITDDRLDAVYLDVQQHLPLPPRLDDFTLPSGLSIRTTNEPRDYAVRYEGLDGTLFDWQVHGIMEPYDINDPSMDPMASSDVSTTGFGAAYSNHFDMSAHVSGTITVAGQSYEVDCTAVMDHSWGPRSERLMGAMAWVNASVDDSYSVSTIWSRDLWASGWDGYTFRHGYALVDGDVLGLKYGRMRASRARSFFPVAYEMRVTDIKDNEHVLVGAPVVQFPWMAYANVVAPHSAIRWTTADGRGAVGTSQEAVPTDRVSRSARLAAGLR